MEAKNYINNEWEYMLTLLPKNLDESAFATGALLRKRAVKSAAELLRLVMGYAVCDLSLLDVSAWVSEAEIAEFSSVAAQKRFKNCSQWLGLLVTEYLAHRMELKDFKDRNVRVRVLDATLVNRPGSKGTDMRIHAGFDLSSLMIDHLKLSGTKPGESLSLYPIREGEVVIADRVYGRSKGIASVVGAGGDVIVRLSCNNLPLEHPDGRTFDILSELSRLAPCEIGKFDVKTVGSQRDGMASIPGRVIALRKSPQAAEQARLELAKRRRKKQKIAGEQALKAAEYVFVFTTLPESRFSAADVLELYRFRWQIEIAFKRLKSILRLDNIPVKDEQLCQTFILAKLLAALLIEDLSHRMGAFSPWGYKEPVSSIHKPSVSRAA